MEIISISLDGQTLAELNKMKQELGFKSRSKMLRSALSGMITDYEKLDALKGHVEAVFILTYRDSKKNNISETLHGFEDAIESELHHHHSKLCVDVLTIHSDAETAKALFGALKRSKSVSSLTYTVVNKIG